MPKSLVEFKDRQRIAPDWIVKGLLKRGNTAFMIGPPKKACKSWMILEACWDLSEGLPLWGIKRGNGEYVFEPERIILPDKTEAPRVMRCVYFTQEDTEDDIHDRLLAHFGRAREANDRLWIVPKNLLIKFDTDKGRALMQAELDKVREVGPIDLIAFDPMRRMHNGEENDSGAIAAMWEVLDRIHKRYNCATLISHHIRKPPGDRTHYDPTDPFNGRGSGDIYGGGDAFMTVVPGKASPATDERQWRVVGMHFESKRGRQLPPAQLKVHFSSGQVEWLGAGFERGGGMEQEVQI